MTATLMAVEIHIFRVAKVSTREFELLPTANRGTYLEFPHPLSVFAESSSAVNIICDVGHCASRLEATCSPHGLRVA